MLRFIIGYAAIFSGYLPKEARSIPTNKLAFRKALQNTVTAGWAIHRYSSFHSPPISRICCKMINCRTTICAQVPLVTQGFQEIPALLRLSPITARWFISPAKQAWKMQQVTKHSRNKLTSTKKTMYVTPKERINPYANRYFVYYPASVNYWQIQGKAQVRP